MTNTKALPSVRLELGDKIYTVEFTMYSLAKLKKVAGKNPLKGQIDINDPDDLIHFLWAGLITHDESLDGDVINGQPDDKLSRALTFIGKLMTFDKLKVIGDAINEAFINAMPSRKESDQEGEEKK